MNIFVSDPFENDVFEPLDADAPVPGAGPSGDDFSLEIAELSLTLSMRTVDGGFEQGVRSAAVSTGNDFLFSFPAAGFAIEASDVACLRVRGVHGATFVYVYRRTPAAAPTVATAEDIGAHYFEFARAYSDMAGLLLDS